MRYAPGVDTLRRGRLRRTCHRVTETRRQRERDITNGEMADKAFYVLDRGEIARSIIRYG